LALVLVLGAPLTLLGCRTRYLAQDQSADFSEIMGLTGGSVPHEHLEFYLQAMPMLIVIGSKSEWWLSLPLPDVEILR
jgi:hypothetical protein